MSALFAVVGLSLANIGLAVHYLAKPPYLAMAAIIIFTAFHTITMNYSDGGQFLSMLFYQMPLFMCQALGVGIVANAPLRDRLDDVLMAVLTCSGMQFLLRPLIAISFGGWGSREEEYVATPYALVSQAMSTIFAVAIALILLVVLMREVLRDLSKKSETDPLSGLLNRRGFELRVNHKMQRLRRSRIIIVICDLDHFKAINDTFGHATGDLVINRFGEILKQCASEDMEIGRIGGEEFAIFLPAATVEDACAYCRAVQRLFQEKGLVPGIDQELSASFGVAERENAEGLWEVIHNADKALYVAKQAGRNCIYVGRVDHIDGLNASAA
ncbi:GGDEF domain-containing protein [Limoniibacter endophyticus]|nr:GGDEF domain-containing protein [Limoniibacter endophyticus]